jgi:primosomal protein N' (replication factor Y)
MTTNSFADIILPFAVRGRFTYRIPVDVTGEVKPGVRVTVQFGRKNLYTGVVCDIHDKAPDNKNVKPIIGFLSITFAVRVR